MQKNYFIARESSRYSVRKQDWFFLLFDVSQKIWFLYMNENYNECHRRKTTRTFLWTKKAKKLRNVKKKKLDNSRCVFVSKKGYILRYRIFHENFEVGIYILKASHFGLLDVFIYKNPAVLLYAIFHWIFEICGGGGHIFVKKQCTLRDILILKKQCTLRYVAFYKVPDTMRYILISKKECTFHYVYAYIIYTDRTYVYS